jgi:hypothetical protein
MQKHKIVETLNTGVTFKINESSDLVDGQHILAEIEGEFFVPNGMSRNGRYYPKSLWEKVIDNPRIKQRLTDRLMFGTVGHDAPLGDEAIREGYVSHIVTNIRIDEATGKGIGNAVILNTPSGRVLNTVIRAGSKLAVSSRANGTFKGKHKGKPVVDEDTYDVEGWDFVVDPGFLEAKPDLKESLQEIENKFNIDSNHEGDNTMSAEDTSKKLVEHIANENVDLKQKVGNLTDELTNMKESFATVEDENKHLKEQLEKLEESEASVKAYAEVGTVEEIQTKLAKADEDAKVLEAFIALADTPEEAKKAFESADTFIKSSKEAFGSIEEGKEKLETLAKYEGLGTFEQVESVLKTFDERLEDEAKVEAEKKTKELSEAIGKDIEATAKLLEKYSEEDILALYEEVAPTNESRFKKKDDKSLESDLNEDTDNVSEGMSLAEKIGSSLVG